MSTIISADQLREKLGHPGLTLLDVRLPEDFATAHIPGAVNQCVFEVAFLPELEARQLPKDQPICIYGATMDSHESRVAAEKLERAGYTEVMDFRGGLQAWITEGNPVKDQVDAPKPPVVADGQHEVDLAESRVVWIGRNLINKHWGHVGLASGHVEFRGGLPVRGETVLDLRRITCTDLAGDALHDVLIHHLESDDFFDVERFPEAAFRFDRTERCSDRPGCCNLKLHGELTLRGITKPLVIAAAAGFTPEGKAALQATFTLDRTDWGVLYGSGRFFQRLAGHLVNDAIELQLRILTA